MLLPGLWSPLLVPSLHLVKPASANDQDPTPSTKPPFAAASRVGGLFENAARHTTVRERRPLVRIRELRRACFGRALELQRVRDGT